MTVMEIELDLLEITVLSCNEECRKRMRVPETKRAILLVIKGNVNLYIKTNKQ